MATIQVKYGRSALKVKRIKCVKTPQSMEAHIPEFINRIPKSDAGVPRATMIPSASGIHIGY